MQFFKLNVTASKLLALAVLILLFAAITATTACDGGDGHTPVLTIGGIPDQDVALLTRRFETVSNYLSDKLEIEVRYIPSLSYAALVTAFEQGDIQLGWFGSLTGVQAREAAPGSQAIVQRARDAGFHSIFIAGAGVEADGLQDLEGLTFTFGSESSSSGHLMPRYYMVEEGVDPDEDLAGVPGYSGSHDKTWQLVETGSYQAGALSEAVWESAVEDGRVDTSRVNAFYTTPPYHNYNWSVRADADATFGDGFTLRLQQVLVGLDPSVELEAEILDLFNAEAFVETTNENYGAIEKIARDLDIIR